MIRYALLDSPIGRLTAIAEDDFVTGLYMDGRVPVHPGEPSEDPRVFAGLASQLDRFWSGEAVAFEVPLKPRGTAFQLRVWSALLDIPRGHTISYGELARRIGHPAAVRAVGRANGANPIAIIIPCHRVIGGNGSLGGYSGGLDRKKKLLAIEGSLSPGLQPQLDPRPGVR
ncbi:MAG: methylated-DNA--[protein]-cysteine S-methyltransferase [Actinomycetota bacterium]|nr:methylated-DNA--[protein]-cysteine S-methyltransferase [Actinomycetota bacterium]